MFNYRYTICDNDDVSIVLTDTMHQVYLLRDLESLIVKSFIVPKTINEALAEIGEQIAQGSFKADECREFIDEAIIADLLVIANGSD